MFGFHCSLSLSWGCIACYGGYLWIKANLKKLILVLQKSLYIFGSFGDCIVIGIRWRWYCHQKYYYYFFRIKLTCSQGKNLYFQGSLWTQYSHYAKIKVVWMNITPLFLRKHYFLAKMLGIRLNQQQKSLSSLSFMLQLEFDEESTLEKAQVQVQSGNSELSLVRSLFQQHTTH